MTTETLPNYKTTTPKKLRYWLLQTYIILMIFLNFMGIIFAAAIIDIYLRQGADLQAANHPNIHIVGYSLLVCLLNMACLGMLLKWKKWAFWAVLILGVLEIPLGHFLGNELRASFMGSAPLFFLVILYQIGGKKKAWNALK